MAKSAGIDGHAAVHWKWNDFAALEDGVADVYTSRVHWWTEPIADARNILEKIFLPL
jgi:hypothetical protein